MRDKTLLELSRALAAKEFSCLELTQAYLKQIETRNPILNAFISVTKELALETASAADTRRAKGEALPLLGIPISHKDILCTQGVKTTCGSKILHNFIAPYSATVVKRFEQAGMILLGKTNLDEFAMGSSNENSFYGPVKNPWDMERVPGGSSGGSAVAVAARMTPAATGTDTGGSIRQPAALTNTTGLKPTYGRVSRFGLVAFASSLDQAGPITATAEDAALLMNVMAGFDEKDSTSVDIPVPDYTQDLSKALKGKVIGIPKIFFKDLEPTMALRIEAVISAYQKMGAVVKDIDLPNVSFSVPVYYVIAPAECSSNLARYDGVRFGYRAKAPKDLYDLYTRTRAEGFGPEVKRRIMIGTYVLSSGYYDAYYLKAQKVRQLIRQDFQKAFETVDIILGPTTPTPAFKLGDKIQDPISMYLSDIYTIAVNLAGLPAISIPAGFIGHLPVGVQMIANYFKEDRLLNFAHQYQQVTDWHKKRPKETS
ncbi:MAG: Asp-tRNA(Asn)/Glu-tRNA(Gln) amidotransferase subunit GatA [Gammaproteobacteria bacterium]|nr:Asp-tRNA(Asn)/Glu-tRNA(Gln) amidotransferase subunit GatA [Gammaproteobacteria bacterium]